MYKNKLQEYCQRHLLKLPTYTAEDHGLENPATRWDSTCTLTLSNGDIITTKSQTPSASKRDAEQKAAQIAYKQLTKPPPPQAIPKRAPKQPPAEQTKKITGAARSRLEKALGEEGLLNPIFVYECILYLPNGQVYRSSEYTDPKRAEAEVSEKAYIDFTS